MRGMDAGLVQRLTRTFNRTERLVVSLHYADGLTITEVAAVLQQSEDDVARILSAVIERVRAAVSRSGAASRTTAPTITVRGTVHGTGRDCAPVLA